ncbi:MAG: class I SAM-dependent methyltransferase [Xanthomonadales bacterium]|nr:class I SAM-dependent methyltransferase [Xanthomonadales bacterium]
MDADAPLPAATSSGHEYDDFAWFYDRYWSRGIPLELLAALEPRLLAALPAGARVLDLCCGTGRVAAALGDRGFDVTGIDGSPEMLALARRNAPAARFVLADARAFRLDEPVQAALSLFDSLNHILVPEELEAVFRNVHAALAPGARFVFDVNDEASFRRHWQGRSFTTVEADHACIVRGIYAPETRIARCDVTLFRIQAGAWTRADVLIRERCHSGAEIAGALERAGFSEVVHLDADTDLGLSQQAGRMFFLARR